MKTKLKKGDLVIVLAGKNRGAKGKVMRVLPTAGRVVVEGVNIRKRRERAKREGQKGQAVEVALPIYLSDVALWCAVCQSGSRIKVKVVAGKKLRLCHRCGKEL